MSRGTSSQYGRGGNAGICRTCGEKILWIKTRRGKNMPCDPQLLNYKRSKGGSQRIVTPEGDVVTGEIVPPEMAEGVGFLSHFASCEYYRAGVRAGALRNIR